MQIERIDHLVLTVRDLEATLAFYRDVLAMREVTFAQGRKALAFGMQKINLHQAGCEFTPHAREPAPGSADLCFITVTPLSEVVSTLRRHGVAVEEGPVTRSWALGPIESVYCRDPDGNLVEIANELPGR